MEGVDASLVSLQLVSDLKSSGEVQGPDPSVGEPATVAVLASGTMYREIFLAKSVNIFRKLSNIKSKIREVAPTP